MATLVLKIYNGLFLLLTLILAVAAFFAIMNILLSISTVIVLQTSDVTVRQLYIIATVRNAWIFVGGALLLGFLVGAFDYHSRQLGDKKTGRILLWTFLIEIVIICAGLII